jgi:hypothetical protein
LGPVPWRWAGLLLGRPKGYRDGMTMKGQRRLAWIGCIGILLAPILVVYGMDLLFGLAFLLSDRD